MKLLTAKVTKQARKVTTKYGLRTVADVTLPNGENITLWQPENSQLINYGYGSEITLSLDSKGKYHLIENEDKKAIAPNSEPTQSSELSNTEKRAIAEFITQQTKLFSF
ncbi:MAG: hypothetical protein ACKO5Q_15370, partial [Microcystaceae cyanobacterium]